MSLSFVKLLDNFVSTLVPSFLIGSFSLLQVTRTTIKACMSLNLKYNQPQTVELTVEPNCEHHKNLHRLTMGNML